MFEVSPFFPGRDACKTRGAGLDSEMPGARGCRIGDCHGYTAREVGAVRLERGARPKLGTRTPSRVYFLHISSNQPIKAQQMPLAAPLGAQTGASAALPVGIWA